MEYKDYSKRKDKLDKKKDKENRVYSQKHVRRCESIMETGLKRSPVEKKEKEKEKAKEKVPRNRKPVKA